MGLMNKWFVYGVISITMSILCFSCTLSLKGISISPDVKTFYVERFRNTAANSPSDLQLRFTEALRSKIRSETRLVEQEVDADIVFEGAVTDYDISAEAASGASGSAFNKLKIIVKIQLSDNQNEKNDWSQSFSFFKDFPTDQSIQDVEDEFVKEIFEQITEDVFNKAFTNW